jgi:hypothetical protein
MPNEPEDLFDFFDIDVKGGLGPMEQMLSIVPPVLLGVASMLRLPPIAAASAAIIFAKNSLFVTMGHNHEVSQAFHALMTRLDELARITLESESGDAN